MATSRRLQLGLILGMVLVAVGASGGDEMTIPASGDTIDPALLESIAGQAPVITELQQFYEAIYSAQAMQVWIQQDSIWRSWPRYLDVRETLRQELSLTINTEKATVAQLCDEAASLRGKFWLEEGSLLADGYRNVYMSRLLLEVAQEREPANLAVSDELVETVLTSHPLNYYDPDTKQWMTNREVFLDLRALRSENYAQVRSEIEQGRAFTFADFARVADFVEMWSARDPQKAAEAFEWALAQVGPSLAGSDYERYARKVLEGIWKGEGVRFRVYLRLGAKYPHDYLYDRRLPSFRGPDPEGMQLTPMLGVGEPARVLFDSLTTSDNK